MDKVTLENYRCFHNEQVARLAPLTLLVGDNSTGKTSFLAMIRALMDIAGSRYPDFKEEPYDLGSFDEIAHHRGGKGGKAKVFKAGFSTTAKTKNRHSKSEKDIPRNFNVTFGKRGTTPILVKRNFAFGNYWADESFNEDRSYILQIGTSRGSWQKKVPAKIMDGFNFEYDLEVPLLLGFDVTFSGEDEEKFDPGFEPLSNSPAITSKDLNLVRRLLFSNHRIFYQRPFASAPVRSKPSRTYDPSRVTPDPEGDYVPMYLANMYFQYKREWNNLKNQLEKFGRAAGLFDEISIRPLTKKDSGAFHVQIRKFGNRLKGPKRNIIDVGYGVSQILPVITELLRPDAPSKFLLQQPEVHLHPSAQAALGSLFCQVANWNRQLIVETHSDHLIDRVRMEVRDGDLPIKPEEVSILYFERNELDVRIHSLGLDKEGNVLHAPSNYRRFFMEETRRSLRL